MNVSFKKYINISIPTKDEIETYGSANTSRHICVQICKSFVFKVGNQAIP